MDKVVQPYDKEGMKMAMLKHEETFKEQVYELHRLYETQKMLMKNMPRTRHNHQENISFNQNHHHHHPVTETLNDEEIEDDECEIELTLAPTSFNRKRNMTNKPESSDSVPSFSSSSTGSSHMKRIERITRENSGFLNSNRRNLNNNSSSDRSVKQSPWMYQVLSLNMT